jgi:transposase
MPRHRLSDDEWDLIKDLFPAPAATGRPPRDRRQIVDAILWILRTGAPWRDLPEEYGPWGTAWDLFDRWNADGTLDRILSLLRSAHVDAGVIDGELWCVDGTVVRAARCAAGGGKKGTSRNPPTTPWAAPGAAIPRRSMSSATATATRCTST